MVATLLDLESGQPLAVQSLLNAQQPFGGDVISRISATMMDPDALDTLRSRAHETMAALAVEVCEEAGIAPEQVYEITVCGNATMMQLALGIDPEPLSMAPFTVTTHELPETLAADFGVGVHPRAPAFVFPSLGAYVGGDIVAGMLATGLTRDRRIRLFIDVGTNSEIALGCEERVLATAAPAGPAFEAAQIRCGMRAAEGAIEGIRIADDDVELQVIGDAEPVGLCGSGLVDCVAELVRSGLLDHSGRFIPDEEAAERLPALAPRLTKIGEERVFVMHWRGEDPAESIFLSQRDVRELQFAKASIATGWKILLREYGIEPGDIQQVLLAGSFGAYLSPASAVRIGLVPRLALPRIVSAGNVAGEGAKIVALSHRERAEARSIVREVRVRRALGPRRLQRPLRRRAGVPGMSTAVVACGALADPRAARSRGAAAGTSTSSRCPRCCTTAPSGSPAPSRSWPTSCASATTASCWPTATAAPTARLDELGLERLRGEHCYDVFARERGRRGDGRRARHLLPHRLPRAHLRAHGRARARPRSPPRAARRLLRLLPARRVAGAAAHAGGRARRASARRSASGCRSRCARSATPGSSASSSGSWLRRGEVWRSEARPARAVGRWRAGPVAGHGLRLRKLRLRGVSRATRPNDVLARPGSTVRVAIRRRLLLRGRGSCAESVRHCSPPRHRATVVWLRLGEPTVRWAPPGTVMRTPRRR